MNFHDKEHSFVGSAVKRIRGGVVVAFLCVIALGVVLILTEDHGEAWAASVTAAMHSWPGLLERAENLQPGL